MKAKLCSNTWANQVAAMVAVAVTAMLVGPASVFATTGGGGGSYNGGGGGSNPAADVILQVYDSVRTAIPGDPAANVRGARYAQQGWGEDSITYALDMFNAAMGQTPSPLATSGHEGGTTEGDFRNICRRALADATAKSSDGTRASRVVGVYLSYANWSINWSAHGVSDSEWLGNFEGPWAVEQLSTWANGSHDQYANTAQDGMPALTAIHDQFIAQINALVDGGNRRMVCVALNEEEPANPKIDLVINTDIPTDRETIPVGGTISDTVTLALTAGQTWPAGLAVKADGVLYGPFIDKPARSATAPAGAPVKGTASLTFTGPGTKSITGPRLDEAGFYVWVWSVDKSQNTQYLNTSNSDDFGEAQEIGRVVFAPQVSTQVDNEFVEKGDAVSDQLTFSGAGWPTYAGTKAVVKAVGTLYGPYGSPQTAANTVPAGAPVAGSAQASATAPGKVNAAANVTVANSGYYTWVWEIKQADQTATIDALIDVDFTDGFFQAGETSIAKAEPKLDSTVENEDFVVDQGTALRDTVTVSGTTPGDLWLTDKAGKPLTIPLKYEVFGPYDTVQLPGTPVSADKLVLSGTKDVVNYGAYTYTLGELPVQGYYTTVWSLDTPRLSDEVKKYLAVHEATDGTWAAGETSVTPLTMDLATTVNIPESVRGPGTVTGQQSDPNVSNGAIEEIAQSLVVNKDGSVSDRITLNPLTPGGVWLNVPMTATDHHPLQVPIRVDLFGPFAVNNADFASTLPIATSKFTADHYGDYLVEFDPKAPENSGFYTAVAKVDTAALSDEVKRYLADGALGETATDGPWASSEIVAATLQFDLSSNTETRTISKNEKFSDVAHVAKVDPDDRWIAPNGAPLRVPMRTQVFGPFDDLGDLTHPDGQPIAAKLVATSQWIATGYGDYKIGDLDGAAGVFDTSRLAYSGYYTIVTSVDAGRLRAGADNPMADSYASTRIFLDDRWETGDPNQPVPDAEQPGAAGNRATDGYWADDEQITVRMAPVVETLRQNRLLDEKDLPQGLVDNVRLTLLDETYQSGGPAYSTAEMERQDANANELAPGEAASGDNSHVLTYQGDLWLNVAGQPVEIAVLGDAYGPYNTPQPQTADPTDQDKAKQIGTRHLVFTKSQVLTTPIIQTPGEPAKDRPAWSKPPAGGQSYAKAGVDENGLWITPQDQEPASCAGVFANPDLCEAFNPKEGAPSNTVTGFYTWESKILADQQTNTARPQDISAEKPGVLNAYFESWDSNFWIENETTSVRDQITHTSRTLEPSVDPGGRFFDDVRIGQFRDDHGDFLGLDASGWGADETTATLTVYGPLFAEPDNNATATPPGTPVYTQAVLKAENGYWIVGAEDYELLEALMEAPVNPETELPAMRTWYVFVYEFAGDDRTTEFRSDFGDSLERAYVDYTQPGGKTPVARIDVEKASGGYPAAGFGSGMDGTDNIGTDAVFDADIPETAVQLWAGVDETVFFTVTNVGADALTDLAIADKTLKGAKIALDAASFRLNGDPIRVDQGDDGAIRSGEGFLFKSGDTITFTGVLPGGDGDSLHGDSVTVTGVGVSTGDKVHDHDDWWARTSGTPAPAIDIEKSDSVDVRAGVGGYQDADNNGGAIDDHDTEATLKTVKAGDTSTIYFRATNTGNVNLVDITVADTTTVGDKTVAIAWDAIPPVLAPGAFFTGRGVLEPLAAGETHSDEVEVKARPQTPGPACENRCDLFKDADRDGIADLDADGDGQITAGEAETAGAVDCFKQFDADGDGVVTRAEADQRREGCVVGDKDQWFAMGETTPGVDVEKASGAQPAPGAGNMGDQPDNAATDQVVDADTADTAAALALDEDATVYVTVSNTGDEDLQALVISDETVTGEPLAIDLASIRLDGEPLPEGVVAELGSDESGKVQTVTFSPEGFSFPVGSTITFSGAVSGGAHTDLIRITAVGVKSGKPVEDEDPWFAATGETPIPAVDVEKAAGDWPEPGEGNLVDKPDNAATEKVLDADTLKTAHVAGVGEETTIYVKVTNKGADDLVKVKIADRTIIDGVNKPFSDQAVPGKPMVIDPESVRLEGSEEKLGATVTEGVIAFDEGFVFKVGATIVFTGTVPGLDKDEAHIDKVRVDGVGVKSGQAVADEDLFHVTTAKPATGKPAIDVEKFDLRTIALAGGDVKDAEFAKHYEQGDPADRDSDDKALVFYSAKDAERDRIGVIVTNTGGEDLVELKLSDVTPKGFAGVIVEWRVLLVAGEVPAKNVTWDDLSAVVLKPGETIVLDGALTGMVENVVHKDTVAVEGKGRETGQGVADADDWFAKIATTPGDTTWKISQTPEEAKIIIEKTGVKQAALILLGAGLAVVAGALAMERRTRRRQTLI
jgi:hypothetical protein